MRKFTQRLIRAIQRLLLAVFLTLIYAAGIGATLLFVFLFNRKVLSGDKPDSSTFWLAAAGYEAERAALTHQS